MFKHVLKNYLDLFHQLQKCKAAVFTEVSRFEQNGLIFA